MDQQLMQHHAPADQLEEEDAEDEVHHLHVTMQHNEQQSWRTTLLIVLVRRVIRGGYVEISY
eukprot:2859143-Pyramimonas_sp.AAC.2